MPTFRPLIVVALACPLLSCGGGPVEWMSTDAPQPTIFAPGAISTGQREERIAFTPDGGVAYFTRRPRRGAPRIFVSRYVDGRWTAAWPAPFSEERDEGAFITADGSALFFSSRRPMRGSRDRSENIWMARREGDGWSEPEPLPGTVNQPHSEIDDFDVGDELGPTLLPGGVLLYSTRVAPDWGSDIYVAQPNEQGAYTDPHPLRINSNGDETNPVLSPDGRYLVFQAYGNADGLGGDDLYVSRRTEYGWSDPDLLPEPINSLDDDGSPGFSPDGRLFFFASDRGARGGYEDIYFVNVDALGLDMGGP